ncbi:Epidermal growth factor-binding protein type B [Entomophthora muscae]|uniref:Epidermal growth factor-binding protein type B n=1 Tax=Entomophthora muscae TaxID=34485 RepID=A0ACC2TQ60_9FUNG|nr:Epidermal growth factor-binding protein type B [Entomophthora muscae]
MLKVVFVFSLLAGLALAKRSPRERIIGGYEVMPNTKYPWVVSLALMGSHQCGGMIYKNNIILTAAHCTIFDDEDWTVRFRYYDFSREVGPSNEFEVAKRRPHPLYNNKKFDLNDIALWKIKGSFNLRKREYITIDKEYISYSEGKMLKVVGWGGLKQGAVSIAS